MAGHRLARPALETALKALDPGDRDASVVHLARNYARLLDAAAPAGRYAKAVQWLEKLQLESPKQEEFRLIILIALAEHSVNSDLGPKLLAALDALGLTPAARAKLSMRGIAPSEPVPESAHQKMIRERDELAARRAGRAP